eukprot:7936816-Ditylum_brightwellii.AAC.1
MLMYLAANSQPGIAMTVHQYARYLQNPRKIHEKAIKRIAHYLTSTMCTHLGQKGHCGTRINPTNDLTLDYFVDTHFYGLWGSQLCKSCTGFVLTLGGTSILWISKLQSEMACSTMEAKNTVSTISTIWEDNNGALILTNNPMPCITPRSNHIVVKYH